MNVSPQQRNSISVPLALCLLCMSAVLLINAVEAALPSRSGKVERRVPLYGVLLANKITTDDSPVAFLFERALVQQDFCVLPPTWKEE